MVLWLIKDIERALDNDCLFAALSLALTLPDICGKAAYPNEKVTKRYIFWYDEYITRFERSPYDDDTPYLSGEVIYSLRNSMLHQGTPNIDAERIKEERNKIDHFNLVVEKNTGFNALVDTASVSYRECPGGEMQVTDRTYNVDVRRLCTIICEYTRAYYEEHRELFTFFQFTIVDRDQEFERLNRRSDT